MNSIIVEGNTIGTRRRASGEHIECVEIVMMSGVDGAYVETPVYGTVAAPATAVSTIQGVAGGEPVEVTGSLTIDTTGLALDATLTNGTQVATVHAAAKGVTAAANVTSTGQGADHQALDVQIYHGAVAVNPTQIRSLASATDSVTAIQGNAPWTTNQTQVGGNAIATGVGNSTIGTTRVVVASDQPTLSVSAVALTDGTQIAIVRGGAKGATTASVVTSTAEGADHQALDAQLYHGNVAIDPRSIRALAVGTDSVAAAQSGVWTVGVTAAAGPANIAKAEDAASADADVGVPAMAVRKAVPANSSNADGDYEFLQVNAGRLWCSATIDAALPAGANIIGALVANQSVNLNQIAGTATSTGNGVANVGCQRVTIASDNTAFQVTANIGTTNGLALDATLTGGTAKSINRGGAKGATAAADVTSTAQGVDHQALDIQVYHGGAAVNPTAIRALTAADIVTAAQGAAALVSAPWRFSICTTGGSQEAQLAAADPASNTVALVTRPILTTLTKGTQDTTGVSTQDLKDAGRNVTNYFMAVPIITTAADALVALTGYKGGIAVAAATAPAVVSVGKRYRITSVILTYVAIATAGSAKVSLRANLAGAVVVGSPVVCTWVVGGPAAAAGVSQSVTIDIPDGLEFAAGTGIGITISGLGATQAAAATGYVQVALSGFEY